MKPQQQGDGAGSTQQYNKKQSGDQAQQGHSKKKKEKQVQVQPQGRLSAVPVDVPLTKAQKNLLRSLKMKEKKGPK
jgi:hypothetical protein